MKWRWTVLSDGWTSAHEVLVIRGGSPFRKVRFHATAVLLESDEHGAVLFDTGYSPRFFKETGAWPYRLYRWVTPVTITEPGGVAAILRKRGISPETLNHVIISHWHADHIGGLRDFPEATIHTSQAAWNSIQELTGIAALRRAFLPGLVPDDAASRLNWIREGDDPFGDGSLQVLDLPGHAAGQVGVRFTAEDGAKVLLAADACWLSDAYRKNRMPHPATRLVNDWEPYRASLDRLHRLHRMEPDLRIVPCHCPETAARIATEHA